MLAEKLDLTVPFSLGDLIAAGETRADLRRMIRAQRFVRLGRGVFVDRESWRAADEPERHRILCRGLVRLLPPGAVFSHDSAALFHGLSTIDVWEPRLPTVTVMTARRERPQPPTRYRLHRAALPAAHVGTSVGLPMTQPARTVVDLARRVSFEEGVVLADSALRSAACSPQDLRDVYAFCRDWPGALAAGRVVYFADPSAESALESLARACFHTAGLPRPRLQVPVTAGSFHYRLDFLFERECTVVEADGMAKYTDMAVLRDEKLREDRLRDLGLEVVRLTWSELRQDPATVVTRIRRAFLRAEQRRSISGGQFAPGSGDLGGS